ncbi:F510_1955 family glycosylhydrolase [Streptomyces sp. TRM68416]|uniref:F510_1955 family glycosylhydrolase n=1 Tax=Streptomyces sp. TRM68416 TaxID=2758412 RepID=UPI001CB6D377|nr:sialidase family protein [Streptomyces sp. TRM68416]
MRSRTATAVTAAVLATVLSACSPAADTTSADGSDELTVSHVHGLGVDPADGRLYVATHEGVIAVADDGRAERVGDRADYMGFAVVGARTFLGSGHPAEGSGDHANRGLLESTDSGRTWQTLSLGGTADFHSLKYAHDTVYGYDSTRGLLRVSADRSTWDDRARLTALDIAVSPTSGDLVLATTQDGLARSTDGGRTFGAGTGRVLAFLSWPAADTLYGIDLAGALHRSGDGGATWRRTGTVPGGRPQALTAVDARRVLAATQDGVYESRDGGRTFAERLPLSGANGH